MKGRQQPIRLFKNPIEAFIYGIICGAAVAEARRNFKIVPRTYTDEDKIRLENTLNASPDEFYDFGGLAPMDQDAMLERYGDKALKMEFYFKNGICREYRRNRK